MPLYAGPLWKDGEATEGAIRTQGGRVVEWMTRAPAGARPVVILDGVYNYHTHIGDAFLRGRPVPRDLEALVKPGTGYKHRMLAGTSAATVQSGIRRCLTDYHRAGTSAILDFREQGLAGIRLARAAQRTVRGASPVLRLLGRPAGADWRGTALGALLDAADGIGVPSLTDVGPDALQAMAAECRRARRPLAIHVSEQRREDIEAVLSARPDLLVHLCAAAAKDLRKVSEAETPVAVCPSSNAFFRLRAPVADLHRAGIRFHFGTDNAMLGGGDVVQEAARAHAEAPGVPDESLLRALTTPFEKAIKRIQPVSTTAPPRTRIVVLARRGRRIQWGARPLVADR